MEEKKMSVSRDLTIFYLLFICLFCIYFVTINYFESYFSRVDFCKSNFYHLFFKKCARLGAGEMALRLKSLGALPEDHVLLGAPTWQLPTVSNSSPRASDALFWLLWAQNPHSAKNTHAGKTSTPKENKYKQLISYFTLTLFLSWFMAGN